MASTSNAQGLLAPRTEERPLMVLLQCLINNENSQSSQHVLSDTQIIEILEKEFNIEIKMLHSLEMDIYMDVIKKFLKFWPQWDEFELIIQQVKSKSSIPGILEQYYQCLRKYLDQKLGMTKLIAAESLKLIPTKQKPSITDDVVLEINCTREELNRLFYRIPVGSHNQIFNTKDEPLTKISLDTYNLLSIMNWWMLSFKVNIMNFQYKREMVHGFKHYLVNRKMNSGTNFDEPLKTCLQYQGKHNIVLKKSDILLTLNTIKMRGYAQKYPEVFEALSMLIINDVNDLSTEFDQAVYRKCMNKYPYVRYLYQESEFIRNSRNYDLHLEEFIIPLKKFSFRKIQNKPTSSLVEWEEVKCGLCNLCWVIDISFNSIKSHFETEHRNEPDFYCSHCKKRFTMQQLTQCHWQHTC